MWMTWICRIIVDGSNDCYFVFAMTIFNTSLLIQMYLTVVIYSVLQKHDHHHRGRSLEWSHVFQGNVVVI